MKKLALVLLITVIGCAGGGSAPQRSLYQRLGGLRGITEVVSKSIDRIGRDSRVNSFFENFDISVLREHFIQMICVGSGGPCKYEGRSMPEAHRGLHITNAAFDAVVEDFAFTMKKLKVGTQEEDEVIKFLNDRRKEIVEVR